MAATPSVQAPPAVAGFSPGDRFVLRMGVAATLGFAMALSLDWPLTFLVPMFAVQMVAGAPTFPSLLQGVVMPAVMWIGTTCAMIAASVLADAPLVEVIILVMAIFATFYAKRRGAPAVVVLLLQVAFCIVPLYASVSLDAGHAIAGLMQRSTLAASAVLFLSHLLVPAPPLPPPPAPAARSPMSQALSARIALADTLVLCPLLVSFLLGAEFNNFVILMMTINILNDLDLTGNRRMAVALIAGNTIGGLLAVAAQELVFLADTLVFFLLTVFLSTLWFAGRMARGGPAAGLFGLALGTFLLILGIAIAPLPGGSEQTYLIRILQILFAGVYALAALVIVAPLRRGAPDPATETA